MSRSARSVVCCALFALAFSLLTCPAPGITVGGWTATRGGDSGIVAGDDFAATRNDLSAYFFGATLAETAVLTSAFLNSVDVLMISPVYGGESISSTPLSATEQSALTTWVSSGGRAVIVGENFNYYAASQSMIGPFGPQWESSSNFGPIQGVVTDHTSFPAITDGPFGVVNSFSGSYDSYFANVAPATPLGEWSTNAVSLAAMNYGSGKVVFFGSNTFLYGVNIGINPNNVTLRRNTLAYLLGISPRNKYDYNANGVVDGADYVVWRNEKASPSANSPADGNLDGDVDDEDYEIWRAHFGETLPVNTASVAHIPEPPAIVLLALAALFLVYSRLTFRSVTTPQCR